MNKIFKEAFKKTRGHEVGYVNDPLDKGGETYNGISRKYNPDWTGWEILDEVDSPDSITPHQQDILYNLEKQLYFNNYWEAKKLNLTTVSQTFPLLAIYLYDISVNMGVSESAKMLQRAINILNRDQNISNDLKVDGWAGSKTFKELFKFKQDEEDYFAKVVVILKGFKYIDIATNDSSQDRFIRGWLNRVYVEEQ